MKLIKIILGFLLKYPNANAQHLPIHKNDFYRIKNRIIRKYGEKVCYDKQYIELICDRCNGLGQVRFEPCPKCKDGIFRKFWTRLMVIKLGWNEFHIPCGRHNTNPNFEYRNKIEGFLVHDKRNQFIAVLFFYILFMFFDRKLVKEAISFQLRGFTFYNRFCNRLSILKCWTSKRDKLPF